MFLREIRCQRGLSGIKTVPDQPKIAEVALKADVADDDNA